MSGGGERSEGEGASERASERGREGGEVGEAGAGWGGGREAPRSADRSVLQTRAGRFSRSSAVRASALLQQPRWRRPEGAERRGQRPSGRGGGRRPLSKPPAKCSELQKQAAGFALAPGLPERVGLPGSATVASGLRCPPRGAWTHHAPAGPGRRAQADPRLAPASTRSD